MDRSELARQIYESSHLEGLFRLKSGRMSTEYFDKYRFESDPVILAAICSELASLIPVDTEVIAGLEMGGIPLATDLSQKTKLPTGFVRKKAKEYGTCQLVEGAPITGRRVCVIEDVVTTGGQVIESVNEMRSMGAFIETAICVVLREEAQLQTFVQNGLSLLHLFTQQELADSARNKV